MPQTTKNTLIKKISSYKFTRFGKGNLLKVCMFWEENSELFQKFIENKVFSKSDFEKISEIFSYIQLEYKYMEDDDKPKGSKIDIDSDFKEICKAYITLLVQFNEKFDKYLSFFDKNSSYYKKMEALNIIRHYKGSEEDYKTEFLNIGNLLYDAIQLDPSSYESCCGLAVEYLDTVLPKNSFRDMANDTERIKYIHKYGYSKFIETLKNSEKFIMRFKYGPVNSDKREYSLEGINDIINELFSEEKISDKNRKIIMGKLDNELNEYIKKEEETKEIKNQWIEKYAIYLNKYKGWDGKSEIEVDERDLRKDYHDAIKVEFGDLEDWDLQLCSGFEAKHIDSFVQEGIGTYSFYGNKIIIGMMDKISKEEKNDIEKKLKLYKGYKFKIHELPENLSLLGEAKRLNQCFVISHHNLRAPALDIIWKLNKTVSETLGNRNDLDSKKLEGKLHYKTENVLSNNWEPDEDKEKIKEMKENVGEIDSRLDEYKKLIDRYFSELVEIKKENNNLKGLLQEKGILVKDEHEEDIIEKRKFYRITVIGGREFVNKGYKNLQKNKSFIEKLENEYHLTRKQFDLKGDYDQQKDKKFADGIESGLISGATDFVIVLQSDHETSLFNLINNPEYNSRITCFGELDENGNISRINQHFSYTKFDDYLKVALEKYERKNENDLIGL